VLSVKLKFIKFYGDIDNLDYQLLDDVGFGFIAVKGGFYGIVDRFGNVVLDFVYDSINNFHGGIAGAAYQGKWGVIDKNLKVVLGFAYDSMIIINDTGTYAIINSNAEYQYYDVRNSVFSEAFTSESDAIDCLLEKKVW
jgi:hypothetical protein